MFDIVRVKRKGKAGIRYIAVIPWIPCAGADLWLIQNKRLLRCLGATFGGPATFVSPDLRIAALRSTLR